MSQAVDLCLHAGNNMIGGEIFVSGMGCCNIMSLAKAFVGMDSFDYEIIGEKPGEKSYEELVTETEAQRTVCEEDLYTIIPDSLDVMPSDIVEHYTKAYDGKARLSSSLRSDQNMLTKREIRSMLQSVGNFEDNSAD
jgi:FlaA1/EpsC-like NDP-sugar epimerase